MKKIYNFINKYKKEILVILILIIISICIYYFYNNNNNNNNNIEEFLTIPILEKLGDIIPGSNADDYSGYSVSLSKYGMTVAIGAPYSDGGNGDRSGEVRIYQFVGTNWTQKGSSIPGEAEGDQSGCSVSLSDSGNIIAIGAHSNNDGGSNSGHVRIFEYDGTIWTQKGSSIPGEANYDESGYSVALSSDGNIVAIGAHSNNDGGSNSGHVRIFEYDGTIWTQKGSSIPGEAADDYSGYSVSLSNNGNIVAIGAHSNNDGGAKSGHVRIFEYDGTNWTQKGSSIPGATIGDYSGCSVSLSDSGNIVAIGSHSNNDGGANSGHVRIFEYDGTSWTQKGSSIPGVASGDKSGYSVSLSSDGNIVAIGAPYNDGNGGSSGHVRIFEYKGTDWAKLVGDINGEALGDNSGWSVSLSSDGKTVAIGAPHNASGHVAVYRIPIDDCKGNYASEFSECSAMCGGGEKTKKFTMTEAEKNNGAPCPTDIVEPCNTQECIYDCIGDFKHFKPCSKECGGGIKLEKYEITQESNKLGIDCPYSNNFIKAIPCNMQACPTNPINTIIQEALKESNDRIQESRYKIIDTQYEIDNLNNDLNIEHKNISFLKNNAKYIPVDKTLKFY